jgi:6-pyruvoyltetrahydropterin/6-carboxytetrahydropterin synthase
MEVSYPKLDVSRDFDISAAHHLVDYEGKCKNVHGHNYKLTVTVRGSIDPKTGMVIDYGELKRIVTPVVDLLDHHELNEATALKKTTTENLLFWIWDKLEENGLENLHSLTLAESDKTRCRIDREIYER